MEKEKLKYFFDCIEEGFLKVTYKTTGLELSRCDTLGPLKEGGYLMVIGIVGMNTGQIMVKMNANLVNKIFESINGEQAENNGEIFFSLAEYINMVGGNGINSINNKFGFSDLRLTPPTIFAGNNLENTIMGTDSIHRFYKSESEHAEITIGFKGI